MPRNAAAIAAGPIGNRAGIPQDAAAIATGCEGKPESMPQYAAGSAEWALGKRQGMPRFAAAIASRCEGGLRRIWEPYVGPVERLDWQVAARCGLEARGGIVCAFPG
jgi:hypothetical protein